MSRRAAIRPSLGGVLVSAALAFAAPRAAEASALDECRAADPEPRAMRACFARLLGEATRSYVDAVAALTAEAQDLDRERHWPPVGESLRRAEAAFSAFVEADCGYRADRLGGGPEGGHEATETRLGCEIDRLRERVRALRDLAGSSKAQ